MVFKTALGEEGVLGRVDGLGIGRNRRDLLHAELLARREDAVGRCCGRHSGDTPDLVAHRSCWRMLDGLQGDLICGGHARISDGRSVSFAELAADGSPVAANGYFPIGPTAQEGWPGEGARGPGGPPIIGIIGG